MSNGNSNLLTIHFQNFEYDEVLEVLMDREVFSVRASTLPGDWFVFINPDVFEQLKLSLLISSCIVTQEENSTLVEIVRP